MFENEKQPIEIVEQERLRKEADLQIEPNKNILQAFACAHESSGPGRQRRAFLVLGGRVARGPGGREEIGYIGQN